MNQPVTLGTIIRDARLARGLSQEQLAFQVKRSKSFISDLEADRYSPGYATINLIASSLNLNPDNLRLLKRRERAIAKA